MSRVHAPDAGLPRSTSRAAPAGFAHLVRLPAIWRQRLKNRHELSLLDGDQMRDAGLNPDLVRRECAKPFWQA